MRTASDHNQAAWRSDAKGDFGQFARSRRIRHNRDEPDTRGDLGHLLDPHKLRIGPGTAMSNRLRRLAIIVLHVSGQGVMPRIETPRQAGAEYAIRLCRRVE